MTVYRLMDGDEYREYFTSKAEAMKSVKAILDNLIDGQSDYLSPEPTYTESEVTMIERGAVLKFARELNEKMGEWKFGRPEITLKAIEDSDFLSVLRNHGIEEKELMK